MKERITILALGDKADYDTFKKFNKEKRFIEKNGFDYVNAEYNNLLKGRIPEIRTEKIIVFLFFPFKYWNKNIEHKRYEGIYGNRTFFEKFIKFWENIENILRVSLKNHSIFSINRPYLCGLYRDKNIISKRFTRARTPLPKRYNIKNARKMEKMLGKGHNFFIKPRYGSMGKGITSLSWSNWKTNFSFKNNKIISKRSDRGWHFRDITERRDFLRKLLKEDYIVEKKIDSILLKDMIVDMRIYTFLKKVIYVYPRKNKIDRVTTNITQGGQGDPGLLKELPKKIVTKATKLAERASRTLGLNMAGMDVMVDRNLRNIYMLDINVFPGFPKKNTYNFSRNMIAELSRKRNKGEFRFEKGSNQ